MHNIIEEVQCLGRGIVAANFEALATVADTFSSVMHRVANTEETTTAQSWSEGLRSSAGPYNAASEDIVRGIGQLPRNVLRAYDRAYFSSGARKPACERSYAAKPEAAREPATDLEDAIFLRARREIRENGGKGALLSDFVHDVARDFDVSEDKVRSLVSRHFIVRGEVIREKQESDTPNRSAARERLNNLGYTDIREDVPLQLIDEHADLIAFEGGKPRILCYVTDSSADNLSARTYARLQANSFDEKEKPIQFIWVTDGRSDYFADLTKDSAISALPRASAPK